MTITRPCYINIKKLTKEKQKEGGKENTIKAGVREQSKEICTKMAKNCTGAFQDYYQAAHSTYQIFFKCPEQSSPFQIPID